MGFPRSITVRITDEWKDRFHELQREIFRHSSHDGSMLLRQLVEREHFLWLQSPYVATSSKHFIFVDRHGNVYFRDIDTLELRAHRVRLPVATEMKLEKQAFYEHTYRDEPNSAERIREHWLLNHFGVWLGEGLSGEPLLSVVDHEGTIRKTADLEIHQPENARVTREIIGALRDYVQRRSDPPGLGGNATSQPPSLDRGGVVVGIPTLNLGIAVVVDLDLYHGSEDTFRPALKLEFRNLESARFEQRTIRDDAGFSWRPFAHPADERQAFPEYEQAYKAAVQQFEELQSRVLALSDEQATDSHGQTVVRDEKARARLRQLELPERFLFCRLVWPTPYLGFELCITWNKPA